MKTIAAIAIFCACSAEDPTWTANDAIPVDDLVIFSYVYTHFDRYVAPSPAVTGCGVSPIVVGDDNAGVVLATSGGECMLTFAFSYSAPPSCIVFGSHLGADPHPTSTGFVLDRAFPHPRIFLYECVGRP